MKTSEQLYTFYEEEITVVFLKLKPNCRKLDSTENCQNTRRFRKALPQQFYFKSLLPHFSDSMGITW